jgi:streptomycin 3"-adenylyltransferase
VPSRSDVDILGIVAGPLSSEDKHAVAAAALGIEAPGAALDLVLVSSAVARSPEGVARHELVVYSPEPPDFGSREDPSLFVNLAITRAHGLSVLGPRAERLIAPVPRAVVCRGMSHELAADDEHLGYALLNACRALMYVREGVLVSKFVGAEWAVEQGEVDPHTVEVAVEGARGGPPGEPDREVTLAFVSRVRQLLLAVPA